MSKGITITSKGQFTLPVHIRQKLRLNKDGDTLVLEFDEKKQTIQLSKPVGFADMQQFVQTHSRDKAAKIPEDIHGWYGGERAKELENRGTV